MENKRYENYKKAMEIMDEFELRIKDKMLEIEEEMLEYETKMNDLLFEMVENTEE